MTANKNQKLRVIVDGVHIHTTVGQVIKGIGDHTTTNDAVRKAWQALVKLLPDRANGLSGEWEGHRVQIDFLK